jgi:hypothetical protein
MISLALIFMFKTPPVKPESELSIIKKQGFDSLEYLDFSNELRSAALAGNDTHIIKLLSNLTVGGYEIQICSEGDPCLSHLVPENQTVMVIDYYQSGYKDFYAPKKVRMFLWRKY